MIRKLLVALALGFLTCSTNAQLVAIPIPGSPLTLNVMANPQPLQDLRTNPAATNITMGDDNNVGVPLNFTFPYFGQNFTNSWMYSNGAISFQGPNVPNGFCCNGQPLTTALQSGYNYSILPLWTDLIAASNNSHYVLGTNNSMTYGWYNVTEYGSPTTNNFEVKIDSSGAVDMRFSGAVVSLNHTVTIGLVGNAQKGEFYQYYYGQGLQMGTTQLAFTADPCVTNPLYSPTCPGYQQAYTDQQCTINPLYSPVCPGYAQAYYTQQCTISPLYDSGCPGYAQAYQDKQIADACKANPQSSPNCTGYQTPNVASSETNTNSTAQETTASPATIAVVAPVIQNVIAPSAAASTATNPTTPIAQATNSQSTATTAAVQSTTTAESKTQETKPAAPIERKVASTADAKKSANEKTKEAANEMKSATTMEAQVAAQNSVISLMGFTPGFAAYQTAVIPDIKQLEMARTYSKDTVDNRSVLRQLNGASDKRWSEMVEKQYGVSP